MRFFSCRDCPSGKYTPSRKGRDVVICRPMASTFRTLVKHCVLPALCTVAVGALPSERASAQADNFYAGKTISILASGGGAYDTYSRLFARYMPKYIPGHPAM